MSLQLCPGASELGARERRGARASGEVFPLLTPHGRASMHPLPASILAIQIHHPPCSQMDCYMASLSSPLLKIQRRLPAAFSVRPKAFRPGVPRLPGSASASAGLPAATLSPGSLSPQAPVTVTARAFRTSWAFGVFAYAVPLAWNSLRHQG